MFEWIGQHVDLFLASYARIGENLDEARHFLREHREFKQAAMVGRRVLPSDVETQNTQVNITHIEEVANRLLESGHYAASRIDAVKSKLHDNWQLFAQALKTRETVLALSVSFQDKAQKVACSH